MITAQGIEVIERVCENPRCPRKGNTYYARRKACRFCSDTCRKVVWRSGFGAKTFREQVKDAHGAFCAVCGSPEGLMYVWESPEAPTDPEQAVVLCGHHHQLMAQTLTSLRRRVRWLEEHQQPVPADLLAAVEVS